MRRVYLDNSATTPLRPIAKKALCAALDVFGNPSSVHREGQDARHMLEAARRQIAAFLHVRAEQIVLTASGTEANVMAVKGLLSLQPNKRLITSPIEHDSILNTAKHLQDLGTNVTLLAVDEHGIIDADMLEAELKKADVGLVSVMHANNETGVIQPLEKIAELCRKYGVYCHTDAVQTVGHMPVDFVALGVHSLAFAGHKFGAPKGTGVLVIENEVPMTALIHGGAQEKNRRAGTENIPAIFALGAVCEALPKLMTEEVLLFKEAQTFLEKGLMLMLPKVQIVGKNTFRLPHCTQIIIPHIEAEQVVIAMDMAGVAISQGAACSSGKVGASHVLLAQGFSEELANKGVRISFGWHNKVKDAKFCLEKLQKIVQC